MIKKLITRYQFFIAFRYLKVRHREAFISLLTVISIIGVSVGVIALVVAQALTAGTHEAIIDKIVGNSAHLHIYSALESGGMSNYEYSQSVLERIPGIKATAGILFQWGLIDSQGSSYRPAFIYGVVPEEIDRINSLFEKANLVEDISARNDWILVAKGLAQKLHLKKGERVRMITASGSLSPIGMIPVPRYFRFAGTFETGLWQTEDTWCYIDRKKAQKMFNMEGKVNLIQAKVVNLDDATAMADKINSEFNFEFTAMDWTSINKELYSALKLEKLMLFLTLGIIVAVAALNIVSLLVVIVVEKQKSIGVLRAMGADSKGIMTTFIILGLSIGIIGTVCGVIGGFALSTVLDYIGIPLDEKIYPIAFLRFKVELIDILWVVALTMCISLLSTIYPARRASKFSPAESLRNE